jgi:hypothetical protein
MSRNRKFVNLAVEQVEDRLLLAGNVSVNAVGDTLNIRGDSADNQVAVVQLNAQGATAVNAQFGSHAAAGDYLVIGQGTTHLKGTGSDVTVAQINQGSISDIAVVTGVHNITITTLGGNDAVTVGVSPGAGPLASPFSGPESLALTAISQALTAKDLTIRTGSGDDIVQVGDARTQTFKDIVINTDGGNDTVLAINLHVTDDLTARLGGGNDTAAVLKVDVDGNTTVNMGAGDDQLAIAGPASNFHGKFRVRGQAGDDTVAIATQPNIDDTHFVLDFENVL